MTTTEVRTPETEKKNPPAISDVKHCIAQVLLPK